MLLFLLVQLSGKTFAGEPKERYEAARLELTAMLNGNAPLSYERAIYLIENAYWEDRIDSTMFRAAIDRNTAVIRDMIASNHVTPTQTPSTDFWADLRQYRDKDKGYFDKAVINWAIFTYMTDTVFIADKGRTGYPSLIYTLPLRYSTQDPLGTVDWSNTQVTHLLSEGKGNCFALASLYKIFADRLHSDATICTAPGHIYIMHKDDRGASYNIELSNGSFPGNGTMETLTYTTADAVKNDISLRQLNQKQAIGLCLIYLAKGYEYKYKLKGDGFVSRCAEIALQHDSLNLNALLLKAECLETALLNSGKTIGQFQADRDFLAYQALIVRLYRLGYRDMPLEMKNRLINGWQRDSSTVIVAHHHSPKTFDHLHKSYDRFATLSWGMYDESIEEKPLEKYNRTMFDTKAQKITGFVRQDVLYNDYNFDPVVFAWNVDPLARSFAGLSPYAFAQNSPIAMIDREGKHGEIVVNKGSPSASDPEKRKTSVTATQIYYTTNDRVKGLNGDYSFFDNVKSNDLKGSYGGWEKTWSTAKYNVSFNLTVSAPLETEAQLKEKLTENPVSNYLNIDKNIGSHAGGRYMYFRPSQHSPKNSFSHESGHNWGELHFPNLVSATSGTPSIMSYQNSRAVIDEDVTNVIDPAVELANTVPDKNVTIRVFANEDAGGGISGSKTTYKIYYPSTGEYGGSTTVDYSKKEGAR